MIRLYNGGIRHDHRSTDPIGMILGLRTDHIIYDPYYSSHAAKNTQSTERTSTESDELNPSTALETQHRVLVPGHPFTVQQLRPDSMHYRQDNARLQKQKVDSIK